MVGIPFMSDQPKNVKRMEFWGIGVRLDPGRLTADTLVEVVIEIATNSRYDLSYCFS